MKRTQALIIGASFSGLAVAASLQLYEIDYIIIEKEAQVASPWRNHYERLHLHTDKSISHLPYKKFGKHIPRYPSRKQVIDYLEEYKQRLQTQPLFYTEAKRIDRDENGWTIETNNGTFSAKFVVMATGAYYLPKPVLFKGAETFPGVILHSSQYKTGSQFRAQKILVAGFGNSACEIVVDLYEQGAMPSLSVLSPVNILPRDIWGIPLLWFSRPLLQLPVRLADAVTNLITRLTVGNLPKLGLQKKTLGVFSQIQKEGTTPVLDMGIVRHLKHKQIAVLKEIHFISGRTVHFTDGTAKEFDAIVAAIGYQPGYSILNIIDSDTDQKQGIDRIESLRENGLYFCGFSIGATGMIRSISAEAQKIAKAILWREKAV